MASTSGGSSFYSFPQLTSQEKMDIKRTRGQMSCAECRRLKLKCDKKLPCSSCVRRGCGTICPTGTLSNGQGKKLVLSDTAILHQKIDEMGQRIRFLEDALAVFQNSVSSESHPLLRDDFLMVKFGPGIVANHRKPDTPPPDDLAEALGTLTVGEHGDAKYFGRSAGTESLLQAAAETESTSQEILDIPMNTKDFPPIPNQIPFGTRNFADWDSEKSMATLLAYLPPKPRAWSLCETYMEQGIINGRVVTRDELINDILTPVYSIQVEKDAEGNSTDISPHKLAVLFLVFGIGALVDLTLPPYSEEAELYFDLGRAALSLQSVINSPETGTVQALTLMSLYLVYGGPRYTVDGAWGIMAVAAKLAQNWSSWVSSMRSAAENWTDSRIDRESSRWNMDAKTLHRRRSLFWEIFSMDLYMSLSLGRPPSIRLSYVDCEFPVDNDETTDGKGGVHPGHDRFKWTFAKEILAPVVELTLTASIPSYQTILDLDRKLREFKSNLGVPAVDASENDFMTPFAYMQQHLHTQIGAVTAMYIHRSFFAQAMLDHPSDPLRSPYAPSFLVAYRSASALIHLDAKHFARFPDLLTRWWMVWNTLFSAAMIVGSIVTRIPNSSMAPKAFVELSLAYDLFERAADQSIRARSGLVILRKLMNKATEIFSQRHTDGSSPSFDLKKDLDIGEDELKMFAGHTKVLVSKIISRRRQNRSSSTPCSLMSPVSSNDNAMQEDDTSPPPLDVSNTLTTTSPHSAVKPEPGIPFAPPQIPPPSHLKAPSPEWREASAYTNPGFSPSLFASTLPALSHPQPQHHPLDATNHIPPFLPAHPDSSNHRHNHDYDFASSPGELGFDPFLSPSNFNSTSTHAHRDSLGLNEYSSFSEGYPMELDMLGTGDESGLNAQWLSFMQTSGIMEAEAAVTEGELNTSP